MSNATALAVLNKDFGEISSDDRFLQNGLQSCVVGKCVRWTMKIVGGEGTYWSKQIYDLEVHFSQRHPFEPPRIVFPVTERNQRGIKVPMLSTVGELPLSSISRDNWVCTQPVIDILLEVKRLFTTNPDITRSATHCALDDVSNDIFYHMVGYLDISDINSFGGTSRRFLHKMYSNDLWADLYYTRSKIPPCIIYATEGPGPLRVLNRNREFTWEQSREAYIRAQQCHGKCKSIPAMECMVAAELPVLTDLAYPVLVTTEDAVLTANNVEGAGPPPVAPVVAPAAAVYMPPALPPQGQPQLQPHVRKMYADAVRYRVHRSQRLVKWFHGVNNGRRGMRIGYTHNGRACVTDENGDTSTSTLTSAGFLSRYMLNNRWNALPLTAVQFLCSLENNLHPGGGGVYTVQLLTAISTRNTVRMNSTMQYLQGRIAAMDALSVEALNNNMQVDEDEDDDDDEEDNDGVGIATFNSGELSLRDLGNIWESDDNDDGDDGDGDDDNDDGCGGRGGKSSGSSRPHPRHRYDHKHNNNKKQRVEDQPTDETTPGRDSSRSLSGAYLQSHMHAHDDAALGFVVNSSDSGRGVMSHRPQQQQQQQQHASENLESFLSDSYFNNSNASGSSGSGSSSGGSNTHAQSAFLNPYSSGGGCGDSDSFGGCGSGSQHHFHRPRHQDIKNSNNDDDSSVAVPDVYDFVERLHEINIACNYWLRKFSHGTTVDCQDQSGDWLQAEVIPPPNAQAGVIPPDIAVGAQPPVGQNIGVAQAVPVAGAAPWNANVPPAPGGNIANQGHHAFLHAPANHNNNNNVNNANINQGENPFHMDVHAGHSFIAQIRMINALIALELRTRHRVAGINSTSNSSSNSSNSSNSSSTPASNRGSGTAPDMCVSQFPFISYRAPYGRPRDVHSRSNYWICVFCTAVNPHHTQNTVRRRHFTQRADFLVRQSERRGLHCTQCGIYCASPLRLCLPTTAAAATTATTATTTTGGESQSSSATPPAAAEDRSVTQVGRFLCLQLELDSVQHHHHHHGDYGHYGGYGGFIPSRSAGGWSLINGQWMRNDYVGVNSHYSDHMRQYVQEQHDSMMMDTDPTFEFETWLQDGIEARIRDEDEDDEEGIFTSRPNTRRDQRQLQQLQQSPTVIQRHAAADDDCSNSRSLTQASALTATASHAQAAPVTSSSSTSSSSSSSANTTHQAATTATVGSSRLAACGEQQDDGDNDEGDNKDDNEGERNDAENEDWMNEFLAGSPEALGPQNDGNNDNDDDDEDGDTNNDVYIRRRERLRQITAEQRQRRRASRFTHAAAAAVTGLRELGTASASNSGSSDPYHDHSDDIRQSVNDTFSPFLTMSCDRAGTFVRVVLHSLEAEEMRESRIAAQCVQSETRRLAEEGDVEAQRMVDMGFGERTGRGGFGSRLAPTTASAAAAPRSANRRASLPRLCDYKMPIITARPRVITTDVSGQPLEDRQQTRRVYDTQLNLLSRSFGGLVFVRFHGFESKFNEAFFARSGRLMPFRTRTSRPPSVSSQTVAQIVSRVAAELHGFAGSATATSSSTSSSSSSVAFNKRNRSDMMKDISSNSTVSLMSTASSAGSSSVSMKNIEICLRCLWLCGTPGGGVIRYSIPATTTTLREIVSDYCHTMHIEVGQVRVARIDMLHAVRYALQRRCQSPLSAHVFVEEGVFGRDDFTADSSPGVQYLDMNHTLAHLGVVNGEMIDIVYLQG